MGFAAELVVLGRRAERQPKAITGTVRKDGRPYDILIQDLSSSGFRASVPVGLNPGDAILVGTSSFGRHEARVIWVQGTSCGCEFTVPLSEREVADARQIENVYQAGFGQPAAQAEPLSGSAGTRGAVRTATGVVHSLALATGYAGRAVWDGLTTKVKARS